VFALYRDPVTRRYSPDGTRTLAETQEELQWFLNGSPRYPDLGLWAAVEKSSGAFLGRCGLLPWTIAGKAEVELPFMIDKARWGEGFATEASLGIIRHAQKALALRRLICLIMPANQRSVSVAQKVGMSFESEYTDGYGQCHIYGRSLREPSEA
jgi:ribosomal-protein-alanine N-acetyltransferase